MIHNMLVFFCVSYYFDVKTFNLNISSSQMGTEKSWMDKELKNEIKNG